MKATVRIDKALDTSATLGGGGNPNSVQVINGTLADPFGDFDKGEELNTAIRNGNASAEITLDVSALQMGIDTIWGWLYAGSNSAPHYCAFYVSGAQFTNQEGLTSAYSVIIFFAMDSGEYASLLDAQVGADYHDLSTYASLIPTTLTIYWHPMPTP